MNAGDKVKLCVRVIKRLRLSSKFIREALGMRVKQVYTVVGEAGENRVFLEGVNEPILVSWLVEVKA